nr:ral-GDS-related protein-like isoform X1 [Manis javanica]
MAKFSTTWSRRSTWGPRWQSWKNHGRCSWLQRQEEQALCLQQIEVFLTPMLELQLVSPASVPEEPEDVPRVASALVPGPELEPPGPLDPRPVTSAGMALHLAEPQPGPNTTRPHATSTWDIPGVVSGPELEPPGPSGPGPVKPSRMTLCLAEPQQDPDPTRPCATSIWDIPGVVSAPVPGPKLEPHEPSGPGPVTPAGMAPGLAEPEPTSPSAISTQDVPREEKPTILAFPPRLVAEQLTLMYTALFTRLTYSDCKAYFLNQPHMRGIEHLAPTIHKECLALKNFASLHAILLALKSRTVHHLESTWGHVSWKRFRMYKKLKRRDKCINRKWLLKEADSMVQQQLWDAWGTEDRRKQGRVPFLGMFLDDLLLDKLPEHNEDADRMKERKVNGCSILPGKITAVLREIVMHRTLAFDYNLEPKEHFMSFLQAVEPLDEEESYTVLPAGAPRPEGQQKGTVMVLHVPQCLNLLARASCCHRPAALLVSWLRAGGELPLQAGSTWCPRTLVCLLFLFLPLHLLSLCWADALVPHRWADSGSSPGCCCILRGLYVAAANLATFMLCPPLCSWPAGQM